MDLDRFGLRPGISETLATTLDPGGRPHAAPTGLRRSGSRVEAVLYRPSRTLANAEASGALIANVVEDPLLFVEAAFQDLGPARFSPTRHGPVLRAASAWVSFRARPARREEGRVAFHLTPVAGRIVRAAPRAPNRGFHGVLEAAVHATRYAIFKDADLLRKIRELEPVVLKCGGPRERKAWSRLMEFLE
jgi:hypothetical protein